MDVASTLKHQSKHLELAYVKETTWLILNNLQYFDVFLPSLMLFPLIFLFVDGRLHSAAAVEPPRAGLCQGPLANMTIALLSGNEPKLDTCFSKSVFISL